MLYLSNFIENSTTVEIKIVTTNFVVIMCIWSGIACACFFMSSISTPQLFLISTTLSRNVAPQLHIRNCNFFQQSSTFPRNGIPFAIIFSGPWLFKRMLLLKCMSANNAEVRTKRLNTPYGNRTQYFTCQMEIHETGLKILNPDRFESWESSEFQF